jgi:hypothetical protein
VDIFRPVAAAAIRGRVLIPAVDPMVDPTVDPAVKGRDPEGDRVDGLVGNMAANMVANPVVTPEAPLASVGPAMAVQVGRTIRGVKAQAMVVQVVRMCRVFKAGRAALPVSMAGISSGKWLVLNPFQGKRAAARIRTAVVVPVVVGAIVDGVQTLAVGPAVRAIGNASRVNFRRKVQRVEHRSKPGPRVSQVRKVSQARQAFLGPPVEPAHRGHRVSQASRVILTLLDPRNHPGRLAHRVLPGPQAHLGPHVSRDFPVMKAR